MTLTQSYEEKRDLLTGMDNRRGATLVTQRTFSYDMLGRPLTRRAARNGQTVNDSFGHNSRSELTSATVNGSTYGYDYDNIGNRETVTEIEITTNYTANELNQYTSISENGAAAFVPQYDADGNQTLIKTETGIWSAIYNAENRPTSFTNEESGTVVECTYDSMGRRAYKKVTVNGRVTLHQRYIYRGYLQIACIDLTRNHHPLLWLITWDPLQSISTRPLAIQKDGTWYTYGLDLTKNVCEVFGSTGYIATSYTYTPYGSVTTNGSVTQPIMWSSEILDPQLNLYYYNYRFYMPMLGRWERRDDILEKDKYNVYQYCINNSSMNFDYIGMSVALLSSDYINCIISESVSRLAFQS